MNLMCHFVDWQTAKGIEISLWERCEEGQCGKSKSVRRLRVHLYASSSSIFHLT